MIAYFDTSAIVPLLVAEDGSDDARAHWLAADHLITVRLALVEARAALAQAQRSGRVSARQRSNLDGELHRLFEQVDLVDVDDALVRSAGDLAVARGLLAYDAVHLAAALEVASDDLVLVAGDRALLAAATSEGLHTATVRAPS